jgi:hypothetical protein
VLSRYEHIESLPDDPAQWGLEAGRARRLAERLGADQIDVDGRITVFLFYR